MRLALGWAFWARRADARWSKQLEDIGALSHLQQSILHQAAQVTKAGGTLVYSTCTMTEEENQQVVERFLAEHEDFELDEGLTACWSDQRPASQAWCSSCRLTITWMAFLSRNFGVKGETMTIELRSCNLAEMEQVVAELGQPAFRAKQLFEWVHKKGVSQFEQMSNLGKSFRQDLAERSLLDNVHLVRKQVSRDGTEKFLLALADGEYIECVLMRYRGDQSKQRNTLCVSSQVGCAMGCTFCATGLGGLVRNLTAGGDIGADLFGQ